MTASKHDLLFGGELCDGLSAQVFRETGLLAGALYSASVAPSVPISAADIDRAATSVGAIRPLSEKLFLNHVFGFEVLGVLLLVIAVGTVALSRSKGGTHARH